MRTSSRHSEHVLRADMLCGVLQIVPYPDPPAEGPCPANSLPRPQPQLLPLEVCKGVGARGLWARGVAACPQTLLCGAQRQRDCPGKPLLLPGPCSPGAPSQPGCLGPHLLFRFTLSSLVNLSPRGWSDPARGDHAQPPGCEDRPLLLCSLLKATPRAPTTPAKAKRVSTFQEFESNTSDAWDAGEDDDELLAMAAERLNTAVVMETARRVLRNHSQRQARPRPPGAAGPSAERSAEPPEAPGGDLRLVKSVSESHAACPEGGGGGERRAGFWKEAWSPLPGEGGEGPSPRGLGDPAAAGLLVSRGSCASSRPPG